MPISIPNPIKKLNQFFFFVILFTVVLYYGRVLLMPLAFAAILAMLMAPVCRKLDSFGWPRAASTTLCVLILLLFLLSILAVITAQVASFAEDLPKIEKKADQLFTDVQNWIQDTFNVEPQRQTSIVKERLKQATESAGKYLTAVIGGITGAVAGIVLTLVYTFLLLYKKETFENFFIKLHHDKDPDTIRNIVNNISKVSQQYLSGRLKSMIILGILYAISLLVIGIKNAVLLAALAALLTLIPYVGPILGGVFPVLMALVTENSLQPAMWVAIAFILIQAIDNYFVEPNVIGDAVNLSALLTIVAIIAGGLVWGVVGMILFIPIISIMKIAFDNIEELQPYGYLLGDTSQGSSSGKVKEWFKKKFKKKD